MSKGPDLDTDVAEPFRFHFEVAYEVANKGACVCVCTKAGFGRTFVCCNPASVWVTDGPGYVQACVRSLETWPARCICLQIVADTV